MAVELGTGYVSVVPSARGFGASLNREVGGDLDRFGRDAGDSTGRTFSSRFVGAFRGVGPQLAGAFAGLGIGRLIGAAIGEAADFQQTTIAFEGILGSGKEAQEVLEDLRDFARRTPFEFPGLAEASQRLLGVGFSVEDLLPTLGTIGDLTSALGQGPDAINGVVRALGQMRGRGKITAEELNQISDAVPGFSAIEAIAESMGITTAEAFAQVTAGAVPADEGIAAILDGMRRFPGAAGAMERQSKTLNGVISNFRDTLSQTAIDFITPYLPQLSAGITWLAGFVEDNLTPILAGLAAVVVAIGTALLIAVGPIAAVIAGIGLLVAGLVYAYQHSEAFRDIVDTAFRFVQTVVEEVVSIATGLWQRFGDDIVQFARDTWDAIVQIVNGAKDVLTGIFDLIKSILTGKWGEAWDALLQIVNGFWQILNGVLDAAFARVRAIFEIGLGALAWLWTTAWEGIKTFLSNTWDSMTGAVSTAIDTLIGFFEGLPGDIVSAIGDIAGAMLQVGRDIVEGILEGIGRIGAQIRDKILSFIPSPGDILDMLPGGVGQDIDDVVRRSQGNATGGFFSGFSMVGEAGPELVYSAGRSLVVPSHVLMGASMPASDGWTDTDRRLLRSLLDVMAAVENNTGGTGFSPRMLSRTGAH